MGRRTGKLLGVVPRAGERRNTIRGVRRAAEAGGEETRRGRAVRRDQRGRVRARDGGRGRGRARVERERRAATQAHARRRGDQVFGGRLRGRQKRERESAARIQIFSRDGSRGGVLRVLPEPRRVSPGGRGGRRGRSFSSSRVVVRKRVRVIVRKSPVGVFGRRARRRSRAFLERRGRSPRRGVPRGASRGGGRRRRRRERRGDENAHRRRRRARPAVEPRAAQSGALRRRAPRGGLAAAARGGETKKVSRRRRRKRATTTRAARARPRRVPRVLAGARDRDVRQRRALLRARRDGGGGGGWGGGGGGFGDHRQKTP